MKVVIVMLGLAVAMQAGPVEPSNFKFMLRGYCFAGSKIEDEKAPGGFGKSDNLPKPMKAAKAGVYLVALPEAETVFAQKYRGMKLLLINGTEGKYEFAASDSRLSIVQEALDKDGTWKPIEYLPQSWCGNSRHRVFLGPRECWEFSAPKYEGEFKTKLRFRMKIGCVIQESNEFEGSVNPDQFSQKQGHCPTDIMDPYLE